MVHPIHYSPFTRFLNLSGSPFFICSKSSACFFASSGVSALVRGGSVRSFNLGIVFALLNAAVCQATQASSSCLIFKRQFSASIAAITSFGVICQKSMVEMPAFKASSRSASQRERLSSLSPLRSWISFFPVLQVQPVSGHNSTQPSQPNQSPQQQVSAQPDPTDHTHCHSSLAPYQGC